MELVPQTKEFSRSLRKFRQRNVYWYLVVLPGPAFCGPAN